jgi:uncharacterized tellurite resistance protein B-like protein
MDKTLTMKLARLLIAAAWSDGELSNDEINAMKDLLFNIPDLSGEEWAKLEVYMESPVSKEEVEMLVTDAVSSIKSARDKEVARKFMDRVVQSDGTVTKKEQSFLDEVYQAIDSQKTGFFGNMAGLISSSLNKRREKLGQTPSREDRVEDYIKNTVYFKVKTELAEDNISFEELGDEELRKLCLAAGIMAIIAWVDRDISENEKAAINKALLDGWGLDENKAAVVTGLACSRALKGLDCFRLCRSFFKCTDYEERKSFLKTLFVIANSSENTSSDEIEEIRTISNLLRLTHEDFINAKLTVPREDRGGL